MRLSFRLVYTLTSNDMGILAVVAQCTSTSICTVLYFLSATLLFNPLVYTIVSNTSVRFLYSTLSVATLVIGLVTSSTFRPRQESDITYESTACTPDAYTDIENKCITVSTRSRVIMGSLWFLASLCKSLAYYGMYMMLVRHKLLTLHMYYKIWFRFYAKL